MWPGQGQRLPLVGMLPVMALGALEAALTPGLQSISHSPSLMSGH